MGEYERSSLSEIRKLPTSASRPCHQLQLTSPLSLQKTFEKKPKPFLEVKKIELSFLSDGQQQRGRMKKSWNQRIGQQKEKQYKMFDRVPIINLQLSPTFNISHTKKKEVISSPRIPAKIANQPTSQRDGNRITERERRGGEWNGTSSGSGRRRNKKMRNEKQRENMFPTADRLVSDIFN